MKRIFILFLTGAVVGTLLDMLQTYGGQAYYTDAFLFQTAWWVPLLFGWGVVLIGVSHVKLDYGRRTMDYGLKFFVSLLFLILACLITAFGAVSNPTKAILLLVLYLCSWGFWDRRPLNLFLAMGTGLIGCSLESFLGKMGLYHYYQPDLFGVPYWLFFLYLHVSAAGGYLGRVLLGQWTVDNGQRTKNKLLFFWFVVLYPLSIVHSPLFAQQNAEYFKEIAYTQSKPHYFEGLWPLLNPKDQNHYQFVYNEKHQMLKVSHFNEKGILSPGSDGWAVYQLTYDAEGRVVEASFHKPSGSLSMSRSFKFARETIQYDPNGKAVREYFSPEGRHLKSIGKDLGIGFFEVPLK